MVKVQPSRRLLACVAASALAAGSAGGGHPQHASADTTGTGSATGSPAPAPGPSGPSPAPPSGPRLNVLAGTTLTPIHTATVYSGPGARYTAIGTVTPAISVTVVQTQGQWVNVSYNADSQYGWLRGSDLNVPAPPSSAAGNGTGQGATSRGRGTTAGSAARSGHQLSGTRHAHVQAALGNRTTAGRTLLVTAD